MIFLCFSSSLFAMQEHWTTGHPLFGIIKDNKGSEIFEAELQKYPVKKKFSCIPSAIRSPVVDGSCIRDVNLMHVALIHFKDDIAVVLLKDNFDMLIEQDSRGYTPLDYMKYIDDTFPSLLESIVEKIPSVKDERTKNYLEKEVSTIAKIYLEKSMQRIWDDSYLEFLVESVDSFLNYIQKPKGEDVYLKEFDSLINEIKNSYERKKLDILYQAATLIFNHGFKPKIPLSHAELSLYCGIRLNNTNIVKNALASDSQIHSKLIFESSPYQLANQHRVNADINKLLILAGAPLVGTLTANSLPYEKDGFLLKSAAQGDVQGVYAALQAGADPDASSFQFMDNYFSPVKLAHRKYQQAENPNKDSFKEIVQLLKQKGAKLDTMDDFYVSVLEQSPKSYEILKLLLSEGLDPNQQDSLGRTMLHWIFIRRHLLDPQFPSTCNPPEIKLVELLIENNASLNILDNKNRTALSYLLEFNTEKIPGATGDKGKEIMDDGREKIIDIIALLLKNGLEVNMDEEDDWVQDARTLMSEPSKVKEYVEFINSTDPEIGALLYKYIKRGSFAIINGVLTATGEL